MVELPKYQQEMTPEERSGYGITRYGGYSEIPEEVVQAAAERSS